VITASSGSGQHGWAPCGRPLLANVPQGRGSGERSPLPALRCDRITAPCVIVRPINGESFLAYVVRALDANCALMPDSPWSRVIDWRPVRALTPPLRSPAQIRFPGAVGDGDQDGLCRPVSGLAKLCMGSLLLSGFGADPFLRPRPAVMQSRRRSCQGWPSHQPFHALCACQAIP
jgi:hypothetical protein